jgi:hypothetical protein
VFVCLFVCLYGAVEEEGCDRRGGTLEARFIRPLFSRKVAVKGVTTPPTAKKASAEAIGAATRRAAWKLVPSRVPPSHATVMEECARGGRRPRAERLSSSAASRPGQRRDSLRELVNGRRYLSCLT